jgi:hypothetical protein
MTWRIVGPNVSRGRPAAVKAAFERVYDTAKLGGTRGLL